MAEIGRYFVYGAATEAQEALKAERIESRVELRIPNLAAFGGEAPTYVLVVDDEHADQALALISMPEVEGYQSIMACPSCGSKKVVQTHSLSDAMPKLGLSSAPEDRQLLCLECEHRWDLL